MAHFIRLFIVLLVIGCHKTSSSDSDNPPANNPPPPSATPEASLSPAAASLAPAKADAHWIEKAAQVLRHGKGASKEEIDQFTGQDKADVVQAFIQSKEFLEATTDFALYFLGFKLDAIAYQPSFASQFISSAEFGAAMHAAREVARNGDFLTLLQLDQPLYIPKVQSVSIPSEIPATEIPATATAEEKRVFLRQKINEDLDSYITLIDAPDHQIQAFCTKAFSPKYANFIVPYGLSNDMRFRFQFSVHGLFGLALRFCTGDGSSTDWAALRTAMVDIHNKMTALLDLADQLRNSGYNPKSVTDLLELDSTNFAISPDSAALAPLAFWNRVSNSSTNFNRRRASYILKRYFCDDLTPISVQMPDVHAESRHASDPSCQSCHYKLDPMAGFFKERGSLGINLTNSNSIFFDDNATKPAAEYFANWKAPAGSGREWDIGYVRSSTNSELNSYGENLSDLFKIIQQAPEVRQCLVRRMYEYFVSPDQAFDAAYLDYLTATFNKDAKENSSNAYRNVVQTLLLSNGFAEQDPVSSQCYDYAPGDDPKGKPPCQIAAIVERNCVSCHKGQSAAAGLDLAAWKKNAAGEFTFPHSGKSKRTETFSVILERLTTIDAQRRMPLNKDIAPGDLEKLFKWVNQVITQGESTP